MHCRIKLYFDQYEFLFYIGKYIKICKNWRRRLADANDTETQCSTALFWNQIIFNTEPLTCVIFLILQTCHCCRETGQTSKTVILDECYDGTELIPDFKPTTSITEPSGCSCSQCRNWSNYMYH